MNQFDLILYHSTRMTSEILCNFRTPLGNILNIEFILDYKEWFLKVVSGISGGEV